jgi:signal transduction histidine kinase
VWWPIRNQILVPFAVLLLACVGVISVTSALLAARRAEQATVDSLNQVIATLGRSSFPLHAASVLERMKGLSGAEFVAYDAAGNTLAATLEQPPALSAKLRQVPEELMRLDQSAPVELGGTRYFAANIRPVASAGRVRHLLVLYPVESLEQARWEAALPPLAVGTVTLILAVVVSAWLAQRMSRRLRSVQEQVADIAAGHFRELTVGARHDEIQELARSVNRMSQQLQDLTRTIQQTERSRLLGQLAGGLAHQLRNALTGARLAVQIHRRRCELDGDEESLEVALRQLALTEEQVKGLLSLGRIESRPRIARPVGELVEEISALVGPAARHAGVVLTTSATGNPDVFVGDAEGARTAVLNLALNAIDAAGGGGRVELLATVNGSRVEFEVIDDGPGPPARLAETMFDVFVTSKPEGVGFGLALARQVAEDAGGELTWQRRDGRTVFRLAVPVVNADPAALSDVTARQMDELARTHPEAASVR